MQLPTKGGAKVKTIIAVATDMRGPYPNCLEMLEKHDYLGSIELRVLNREMGQLDAEFLRNVSGLIIRPSDSVLDASHLKFAKRPFYIGTISAGTSHLSHLEAIEGVSIINAPGENREGTASLTLSLANSLFRPIHIGIEEMGRGHFTRTDFNHSRRLEGCHWVVFGSGNVSRSLLNRLAVEVPRKITVVNRLFTDDPKERLESLISTLPSPPGRSEFHSTTRGGVKTSIWGRSSARIDVELVPIDLSKKEDLISIVSDADVVSLNFDGGKDTAGLFDKRVFAGMEKSAILVNVGRGALVVSADVVDALEQRRFAGYAADVLSEKAELEKDPDQDLIWSRFIADRSKWPSERLNILLTPHIGGHVQPDLSNAAIRVARVMLEKLNIQLEQHGMN